MSKIAFFSGTEDGRKLSEKLADAGHEVIVSVATEYGEELASENDYLRVRCGRMDIDQMQEFYQKENFDYVIDATHPYATEVSSHVKQACNREGISYIRMQRDSCQVDGICEVEDILAAAKYLSDKKGNIFVSTGSKELLKLVKHIDEAERLVIRMLPDADMIQRCLDMGIKRKQLICMQGPFSKELNEAMFRQSGCEFLLTKESGSTGGFLEKIEAAKECHMETVVIARPKEEGISFEEVLSMFGVNHNPVKQISLVGIGMGSIKGMTEEAVHECKEADLLIGAKRMIAAVEAIKKPKQKVEYFYLADEIRTCIQNNKEERVVVLLSGDTGFYSGAKKLIDILSDYEVKVFPGISTVSAMAAKCQLSWDDMKIVSLHGRNGNLVDAVKHHKKVFALVGGKNGISEACRILIENNLSEIKIYVGSNLSYPNEKVIQGHASDFLDEQFDGVSALIICNNQTEKRNMTHGIPDELFERGKVPMTKEEVRAVSLSKLNLKSDSIIYDIGAGTGSVAIECALRAYDGLVYAIEKKEEALSLLEINKKKFGVSNVEIISGVAPDVLCDLLTPTHAFIGGSSGNLSEIVDVLYRKNPEIRIVANAISLETISELNEIIKERNIEDAEIVNLQVSKSKKVGKHHLMMGNNPVYVVRL